MKNRIGYIDDNKMVFKIDLSDLSGKKLLEHIIHAFSLLEDLQEPINFYLDIRKCKLNAESLEYIKISGKRIQSRINRSGIIGVSSDIKPLFDIYRKYTNSSIKSFKNDAELKKYLGINS